MGLFHRGWDHHGSLRREDVRLERPKRAREVARLMAAQVQDLKQRGLLDRTLFVGGGEFGHTSMAENRNPDYMGRDHHPRGFRLWMAGGGTKPGLNYGATDGIGFPVAEEVVHVHDLQATILYQFGLDARKLSYRFQGLDRRLIGPTDEPKVVTGLLT